MERLNVSLCCFTQQTHQGCNNVSCKKVFDTCKLSGYLCATRFNIQKFYTQPSGVFLFCSLTTHPHSIKWSEFRLVSRNREKQLLASSCLSVCPRGTIRFPLDEFSRMLIFEYVSKIRRENPSFIKISDKYNGHVTWKPMYISLSHIAQILFEWEMF